MKVFYGKKLVGPVKVRKKAQPIWGPQPLHKGWLGLEILTAPTPSRRPKGAALDPLPGSAASPSPHGMSGGTDLPSPLGARRRRPSTPSTRGGGASPSLLGVRWCRLPPRRAVVRPLSLSRHPFLSRRARGGGPRGGVAATERRGYRGRLPCQPENGVAHAEGGHVTQMLRGGGVQVSCRL